MKKRAQPDKDDTPRVGTKKKYLEALAGPGMGMRALAYRAANVTPAMRSVWLVRYPDFAEAEAEAMGKGAVAALDFAEARLLANIKDGNTAELLFFLKTKGANRGYSDVVPTMSVNLNVCDGAKGPTQLFDKAQVLQIYELISLFDVPYTEVMNSNPGLPTFSHNVNLYEEVERRHLGLPSTTTPAADAKGLSTTADAEDYIDATDDDE